MVGGVVSGAIWNLYNPCGFFRFSGFPGDVPDCVYQAPVTEPGADATITKTVTCPTCTVAPVEVAGALVSYTGTDTSGFDHNGSGLTSATGSVTFAVPAGTYSITLESLPSVYDQAAVGVTETVSVAKGDAAVVNDIVTQASVTKIVDTNVPGITVCIYDAATAIPTDITDTDFAGTGVLPAGALQCAVADASGNATFNGLEAGVAYVAVAQGLGYDQMTDAFSIAVPGTSETNLITPALPGALTKVIEFGDFGLDAAFANAAVTTDVIFCKASLMSLDPVTGAVLDPTQCDNFTTDDAAVAHGGVDTFIGGSDFIFEFNADVAPGNYVICSSAFVTGDFDGNPLTPNETIGYDFMCESQGPHLQNGNAVDGPYTVVSGEETLVTNDFEALATGQLDVYVTQNGGRTHSAGVTVNLYENGDTNGNGTPNELVGTTTTDAFGVASFNVPAGSYKAVAIGNTGFETQDATIEYNVADDAVNGGLDDDNATASTTADVTIDQSPTP